MPLQDTPHSTSARVTWFTFDSVTKAVGVSLWQLPVSKEFDQSKSPRVQLQRLENCLDQKVTMPSFLFLGGPCSHFCSLGWAVMACGLLATGRLAGAGHVDRANRVCLACNSGAIGDEKHMFFDCTALAPLRQQHADLFTPRTETMPLFRSAGPSGGFELCVSYVLSQLFHSTCHDTVLVL